MKRFAVAIYDGFDGINKVQIVEASSAINALWKVYVLYGFYCDENETPVTIEEGKNLFPDDISVSDPVEIN